jgi:hypothetical protein
MSRQDLERVMHMSEAKDSDADDMKKMMKKKMGKSKVTSLKNKAKESYRSALEKCKGKAKKGKSIL